PFLEKTTWQPCIIPSLSPWYLKVAATLPRTSDGELGLECHSNFCSSTFLPSTRVLRSSCKRCHSVLPEVAKSSALCPASSCCLSSCCRSSCFLAARPAKNLSKSSDIQKSPYEMRVAF